MALKSGEITTKVTSNITVNRIATWMAGGPGTPVYNWRETTMAIAISRARATAPVNNPANAVHRGGVVGTYLAGLRVARTGNKWGRGFALEATAPHSYYVEHGRSASNKEQTFSWTGFGHAPANIETVGRTRYRDGYHIIEDAIEDALAATT